MFAVEKFLNSDDGSFSHYSVVEVDKSGNVIELVSCVMHETLEDAEQELRDSI